ncbi:MAG: RNA polymerase sigma factor [Bryobacteraceae bacterium]
MVPVETPDIEIVERVRSGETGLYERLMRRYNQRLYRVIRSVIRDDLEAEDVLQEAWVRAYEHLDQFEGRSSFAAWVTRIAYHEALARARKSRRWVPLENEEGEIMSAANRDVSETPESSAMRSQLARLLQAQVENLPDMYRSVFVLREIEQLSTAETAECLGLSEEAVKTRLHRARAVLRAAVPETYAFLGPRCDRTVARVLARIGV